MPLPTDVELQGQHTKEWPLIPADVYQTEITDIEYKTEPNRNKKYETDPDEKPVMKFEFTIIEEGPQYGRKVWQKMAFIKPYPPKQNAKATLVYRLASALAGHAITKDESDRYTTSDVNGFIHRQVRLNIVQSTPDANGKVWNNIDSFMAIKQQLPLFDKNKVPTQNQAEPQPEAPQQQSAPQPEQPQAQQAQSGKDFARSVANSLSGGNHPVQTNSEPSSAIDEINVEDIPF
jgi:hypothetical protein